MNSQKYLMKSNCEPEIEVQMSIILKFKYYRIPCNVKKIQTGDLLRIYNKNRTRQNLCYLASITVLQNVVISDWYINYFLKKIKAVYLLSHNLNDKIYPSLINGESMTQQLSQEELASFKELLISGMIEIQNKLYQRQA